MSELDAQSLDMIFLIRITIWIAFYMEFCKCKSDTQSVVLESHGVSKPLTSHCLVSNGNDLGIFASGDIFSLL